VIVLGVDYGTVRVGISKSDELRMFAHGIGYIKNTSFS